MTAAKPWYDISNEREPGNPLSRMPEWCMTTLIGDYRLREAAPALWSNVLENRLREILAVIDGQREEETKTIEHYEGLISVKNEEVVRLILARGELRAQVATAESVLKERRHELDAAVELGNNLSSALAESYAPCRECGGPPGILMDCTRPPRYSCACLDRTCPNYCDTDCKSSEAHPEARAAWNLANRTEKK